MANLAEVSQWENVIRQLENGEAATGGADGLANVQAKQLANRTKYLKDNYLPLAGGAITGALSCNGNDLAGAAIVAKSLTRGSGYIKYASGLIIQMGKIQPLSGNFSGTCAFHVSFSIPPAVFATFDTNQENTEICSIYGTTTTQFGYKRSKDNWGVRWIAIGH